MEPIRQVSGKRSMLFFGLGAALAGAGFFLKPTKSRGPQGFGFRCGRANMSKFAVRTCCLLLGWPLRFGLPAFIKRNRIDEGYLAGRLVPTARTRRFLHGAREGLLQG